MPSEQTVGLHLHLYIESNGYEAWAWGRGELGGHTSTPGQQVGSWVQNGTGAPPHHTRTHSVLAQGPCSAVSSGRRVHYVQPSKYSGTTGQDGHAIPGVAWGSCTRFCGLLAPKHLTTSTDPRSSQRWPVFQNHPWEGLAG